MRTIALIVAFLCAASLAESRRGPAFASARTRVTIPDITVELTAPVTRQVVQRNGSSECAVTVSGTTTGGDVERIEGKVTVRDGFGGTSTDWATIDSTVSGSFSGTLTIPKGWYDLSVRSISSSNVSGSASLSRVGCGDVFVIAGQSLTANYSASLGTPGDNVSKVNLSSAWALGADQQATADIAAAGKGTPWPAFGDALAAVTGAPVGYITVGRSSSNVDDWQPGGTYYNTLLKVAVQLFPANGFRAVLWGQGESDSTRSITQAAYETKLKAIIDQSRTDAGWAVPWAIPNTETYNGTESMVSQANVQAAQIAVQAYTGCFAGGGYDDRTSGTYRADGVHLTATGQTEFGQRWATAIATHFGF